MKYTAWMQWPNAEIIHGKGKGEGKWCLARSSPPAPPPPLPISTIATLHPIAFIIFLSWRHLNIRFIGLSGNTFIYFFII